jgi:hypothetical protein
MSGPYIGMGLNPVNQTLTIMCIKGTQEEALKASTEQMGEFGYMLLLDVTDPESAAEMHQWLRECKVPEDEALSLMRDFVDTMRFQLSAAKQEIADVPDTGGDAGLDTGEVGEARVPGIHTVEGDEDDPGHPAANYVS